MYDDMFRKTDGIESVVFLLTEMNDGKVKAELIRNPGDHRLVNPAKVFALITVDHFRLSEDELQSLGDVDLYVDNVGCRLMLKPRVYNRAIRNCAPSIWQTFRPALHYSDNLTPGHATPFRTRAEPRGRYY